MLKSRNLEKGGVLMEEDSLAAHLRDRPEQLKQARKEGLKVIGYFPGNYVPEELIYAAGAIPVSLIYGGSPAPADMGSNLMPRVMCPFARSQIGERLLGTNPYYNLIDMCVVPVTCQHLKKVGEIWEYKGAPELFKLGFPHQYKNDFELEYYLGRLKALRERLQSFTGNLITDEKLGASIDLYNRMRELLNNLSAIHSSSPSLLDALDFVKINHASYLADPDFMVEWLDQHHRYLMKQQTTPESKESALLLVGPCLAYGDYALLKLVKAAGGTIVAEEIFEGMRSFPININKEDDLMMALARGYLLERVPAAFLRDSARKRLDYVLGLVKENNIVGVIWYELLGCETYDAESYYFRQKLEEQGIPMLNLESDYGTADTGQLKTRIEGFLEMVKGVV
jgi:benzoyl-CoA reductase/2-hydroxyglutaryl-CoA dehydratase subunit BcrC/BadD/HgdB